MWYVILDITRQLLTSYELSVSHQHLMARFHSTRLLKIKHAPQKISFSEGKKRPHHFFKKKHTQIDFGTTNHINGVKDSHPPANTRHMCECEQKFCGGTWGSRTLSSGHWSMEMGQFGSGAPPNGGCANYGPL